MPKDRIALRELHNEMIAWPFVTDADEAAAAAAGGGGAGKRSPYEAVTQTGGPPACGGSAVSWPHAGFAC